MNDGTHFSHRRGKRAIAGQSAEGLRARWVRRPLQTVAKLLFERCGRVLGGRLARVTPPRMELDPLARPAPRADQPPRVAQ